MKQKLPLLALVLGIASLIVWFYAARIEPFESFSLRFNDVNFHLQNKEPHSDIIFVAVDEPSVNRFGRWPWNREIVAQGLDELTAADVVLMDMIFSEPTTLEQDRRLGDAVAAQANSVCGFFLRHRSTQTIVSSQEEMLVDSALDLLQSQVARSGTPHFVHGPYAEINIAPILESCTMSGTFSTLRDSDQLFRSYPIAFYYNKHLYPSLGVQGLRLYLDRDIKRENSKHVDLGGYPIALDEKGFVRLNYYEPERYRTISFGDLIDGKYGPEFFKHKIVIVGITDVGSSDVRATPMGAMNGPLLHYTFISNVLSSHLIREPRSVTPVLIVLFALLPMIMLLLSERIGIRVIVYGVSYLLAYLFIRWIFVAETVYIDAFYPLNALLMSAIAVEVAAFRRQEAKGRFIQSAFSNYLSPQLLNRLIANPGTLTLGGEKKELSILFSDIRSFTTISEGMPPQELTSMLNRYFTPMTESVLDHGGMLDKYIGDAVMAFFNAPVDLDNHPDEVCACALDMMQKLHRLNEVFAEEGLPYINIGIGINTAEVVVGNMGSTRRFNYTVIGDGVNLASRVEGLNKTYHTNILITEFTKARISSSFLTRRLEAVKVKGKEEAVLLYELMQGTPENREIKVAFEEALDVFEAGHCDEARGMFKKIEERYDDKVSQLFAQRSD